MGVGAGLCMYDVVVKKFTFATLSPDEFSLSHAVIFYVRTRLYTRLNIG